MGDSFWRETLAYPAFPVELESSVGSFVNGSVNWFARNEQLVIFSLDLQTETSKCLLLPAGFDEVLHDDRNLAVLRGCLCFCYDHLGTHFVLWEMKEFGVQDSWTRLVNVSYVHLQFDNIQYDWLLVPVCLLENEDVLLLVSKLVSDDVIMYNWRDDRVEHIELPGVGENQIWYADGHMQSLVVPLPHPH
jgi:F-box interacting protein